MALTSPVRQEVGTLFTYFPESSQKAEFRRFWPYFNESATMARKVQIERQYGEVFLQSVEEPFFRWEPILLLSSRTSR